ncbi:MAG: DUF1876 domain-containing protein [Ilumatobacteraceae bacterium]
MSAPIVWTVSISFHEDDDTTRADAVIDGAGFELEGWGRARRNPDDPDVPMIGEEVAAARALTDLAHHLLDRAAHSIESWAGRPVRIHG